MKQPKQIPEDEGYEDEAAYEETPPEKVGISLYEFYAIGIHSLLLRAPWELERAVSAYHEQFLTEQRCLGLSILLLLGEDHVPQKTLKSMPGFEEQTRISVNQATFLRALKHYFTEMKLEVSRADFALDRMQSYLVDSRKASKSSQNPLDAMLETMVKRVPPKNSEQYSQYHIRAEKILTYVEDLVEKSILKRYFISD